MDGHDTNKEARHIRQHVRCIGHDGHGVREPSTDELKYHESEADGSNEVELAKYFF